MVLLRKKSLINLMFMNFKVYLTLAAAGLPLIAGAQHIRSGYVDWGIRGSDFPTALSSWSKGQKWTDDDNFFISRVKPKVRFRNAATQVNPDLDESNDKKLVFWVPINNPDFNALPDGVYDSEVFPMWSYITHYGNWSTSLVRMPGGFADVAHKNGVPVSVVAGIPYGNISDSWRMGLEKMVEIGPEKMADYLTYYGVDGLGYNSEFNGSSTLVKDLGDYHAQLVKLMKKDGRMPLAEMIWYDGTSESGRINFDMGLGTHNDDIWGYGDDIKTSLFLNYNWNSPVILKNSVRNAQKLGRTALDLYAGMNMQGREPKSGNIWPLLSEYPISIGLWGAHQQNMFFESRAEKGPVPYERQRNYMLRVERWFTGGSRNPINTGDLSNSLNYSADNVEFFGMSKLMSARSALKWNLSEEPFISYFNLGNGQFFNYKGKRQHNSEWYNIGMQDYLPTWMWWFSDRFLGRESSSVPASSLDAEFVWDDAWMGGSSVRVYGSADNEYLHLFKTEFALENGDEITLRYKVVEGSADVNIALSLKGSESEPLAENALTVMESKSVDASGWVEKRFIVGQDFEVTAGGEVAMIALHFKNARDLDIRLGEFSVIRSTAMSHSVETPVIERAELLNSRHDGVDAKVIFNMPNDKGNDVCYNIDVNTSLFQLYAQQEDCEPVLMGMTPSWAGLMFSIPYDNKGSERMRIGVRALSLDMAAGSEIAWSPYYEIAQVYEVNDAISVSSNVLNTGDSFTVAYDDPRHETADWKILDASGNVLKEATGTLGIDMPDGIAQPGLYTLFVDGFEKGENGRVKRHREVRGYIQIIGQDQGSVPQITGIEAPGSIEDLSEVLPDGTGRYAFPQLDSRLAYTSQINDRAVSRGVHVGKTGVGFRFRDTGLDYDESFTVSFWIRPEDYSNKAVHMLNIRDKSEIWPKNNWGWFWHTLAEDGTSEAFTLRTDDGDNVTYNFGEMRMMPGIWHHMAYVFEYNDKGMVKPALYIDGELQKVTSWTRGNNTYETEPDFVRYPGVWRRNNVVSVGGFLHNSGSVVGNVDNFMVWNKALDADGVKVAMGDIDTANLPEGLAGFFDFEQDADQEGVFPNLGTLDFGAGANDFTATELEGQGMFRWIKPEYCVGSPFVKGKAYQIATEAIWNAPGAVVREKTTTAEGGSVSLSHRLNVLPEDNIVPVRLTLRNALGEDSRDVQLRLGVVGVEQISAEKNVKVGPNPFESYIDVVADADGDYRISLLTLDGKRVLVNDFNAESGDAMRICPQVESGLYILHVERDGVAAGSFRVLRR